MRVRIMMPTTGSATASRKRTATRTTARSPLRQTMVGLPFSPMVSTRTISARPSPRRTVGASGGVMLSPQARSLVGDVLAIRRQHLLGIAAAGQFALVQPPDFVGQAADQFLFVRHQQRGGAGAAYAVERDGGALAHQQVLVAEGAVDQQHRRGREIQRIVRPQPADVAGCLDGAGRGSFQSRGEPQQAALSGAVLADDSDHGSVRRDHVQVLQRRAGDVAKCKRHKR